MELKKVGLQRGHVPNCVFETDSGEIKNRDLPVEDQVVVRLKLATEVQQTQYASTYNTFDKLTKEARIHTTPQIEHVVSKHLLSVENLKYDGKMVTTAQSLIDCAKDEVVLSAIVVDCYNAIMMPEIYLSEPGKVISEAVKPAENFSGE